MKKTALFIITILAIAASLIIIWWQTRSALLPKFTEPAQKVTVGNLGIYSALNLIAQAKGYFKDNGLDVNIKEYETGPAAVKDLLDGKLDLATAGEFPGVNFMFDNSNLRIVAELDSQNSTNIIARKDSGISKPADLKGKKVGVIKKSAGEIFLGRFLTFNNLALADVKLVNLAPAELVDQIANGNIDAIATGEPYVYQTKNKLQGNGVVLSYLGNEESYTLLYSTDQFTKNQPQIIERYLRSLVQAEQLVAVHNAEAKSIVTQLLGHDDTYINYIWPKISFSLELDQALILTLEDEARFLIANKLTNRVDVPNYLDFVYFNALQNVKPDSVTMIH